MNTDIRNLSKWLNEEQEAPIDRQALARVLAMAAQPQQEPVAWMQDSIELYVQDRPSEYYTIPLYTAPQPTQRTWVGLTDDEAEDIWNRYCDELGEASINDALDIAQAIESALRSKNT